MSLAAKELSHLVQEREQHTPDQNGQELISLVSFPKESAMMRMAHRLLLLPTALILLLACGAGDQATDSPAAAEKTPHAAETNSPRRNAAASRTGELQRKTDGTW